MVERYKKHCERHRLHKVTGSTPGTVLSKACLREANISNTRRKYLQVCDAAGRPSAPFDLRVFRMASVKRGRAGGVKKVTLCGNNIQETQTVKEINAI